MGVVLLEKTSDRPAFVHRALKRFDVSTEAQGKSVLVKPNIVSHEPYPTTTHPSLLHACLTLLMPIARDIIVADGPAWDAPDTESIIDTHPLKDTCDALGIEIVDLPAQGTRTIQTPTCELHLSRLAFECDLIISLPVLKTHGTCGMTGALKNQIGFLSVEDKRRLHFDWDVDRVIAELNHIVRPSLFIVDAVETMLLTNEARHGGRRCQLRYMLAGTDPVSLDALGLRLLAQVETRLRGRRFSDIPYLRYAADMGIGEPDYNVTRD